MGVELLFKSKSIEDDAMLAMDVFARNWPSKFKVWVREVAQERAIARHQVKHRDITAHSMVPTTVQWLLGNDPAFNQINFNTQRQFGFGDRYWYKDANKKDAVARAIGAKITEREGVSNPHGWS